MAGGADSAGEPPARSTAGDRERPAGTSGFPPAVRMAGIVVGFALAMAATLAVFLTDNALYLRLAVIVVAWAFVITAFSAGRRKTDQALSAGRESELRQVYALELEREVAARRDYELRLENQLRREAQESMRAELDQLRQDLGGLAQLRDQISGLGELRSDMSRLRHELTEQLSGEMLVERIVMRTQSIRMPSERDVRERTGDRLLEGTLAWDEPDPPADAPQADVDPPASVAITGALPRVGPAPRHGQNAPPSPLEWLGERPLVPRPESEPAPLADPDPAADPEPTASLWSSPGTAPRRHRRPAPEDDVVPGPEREPDIDDTAGHQRLTEILAESGAGVPGGRSRRRHREGDRGAEGEDVLARVLGNAPTG